MSELNSIRNFLRLDDRLATSGMPLPEDFTAIRMTTGGSLNARRGANLVAVRRREIEYLPGWCPDTWITFVRRAHLNYGILQ